MIFKSQVLTQASGSVGGVTYSHNGGGMYQRARAVPTDPATPYQLAVRAAVQFLSNYWQSDLTVAERAAWVTYAANVPVLNRLGEQIYISGLAHFIRSNTMRKVLGQTIIDAGPTTYNLGTLTAPVASDFKAGPPSTVDLAFTITDTWHAAGGALYVFASRPQLVTINFFKGPYRNFCNPSGVDASPINDATLPFNAAAGNKLFFRAIASAPDGRLSAEAWFQLTC